MSHRNVRCLVAQAFELHLICEDAKCKRAGACAQDDAAPCITRYKQFHQHLLPELRAALGRRTENRTEPTSPPQRAPAPRRE